MQHYKTVKELIKDYKQLSYPGIIYIQGEKKTTMKSQNFGFYQVKRRKNKILLKLNMEIFLSH